MAGKSSMSANSFNGSLEVGKRTWREGVKLWFKRFIKKKKKKKKRMNTKEISYHKVNEYNCYHQMDQKWSKQT